APAKLLVREVAGTGVPLRAVAVVAEEVLRRDLQRRVLRRGRAVDERLRRVRLRVVGDGDRLVTRERADQDVRAELLDEALRLLDRGVRPVVRAAEADDLDRVPGDRAADEAGGRLVRVLEVAARVLGERGERAADVRVVERAERALTVGQDPDLDRGGRRGLPDRGGRKGRGQRCRSRERADPGRKPEPATPLPDVRHLLPSLSFRRLASDSTLLHRSRKANPDLGALSLLSRAPGPPQAPVSRRPGAVPPGRAGSAATPRSRAARRARAARSRGK